MKSKIKLFLTTCLLAVAFAIPITTVHADTDTQQILEEYYEEFKNEYASFDQTFEEFTSNYYNQPLNSAISEEDQLRDYLNTVNEHYIRKEAEQLSKDPPLWSFNIGNALENITFEKVPTYHKYDLMNIVQPGDIIFERKRADIVLRYLHHVMIVEGIYEETHIINGKPETFTYIRTIEATDYSPMLETKAGGVVYGVLDDERFDYTDSTILRVPEATPAQKKAAISFMHGQLGKPYDIWFEARERDRSSTRNEWYCSYLIWAAYMNATPDGRIDELTNENDPSFQGIDLERTDFINGMGVTPNDIKKSDKVEKINPFFINYKDYAENIRWSNAGTPIDGEDFIFSRGSNSYTLRNDYHFIATDKNNGRPYASTRLTFGRNHSGTIVVEFDMFTRFLLTDEARAKFSDRNIPLIPETIEDHDVPNHVMNWINTYTQCSLEIVYSNNISTDNNHLRYNPSFTKITKKKHPVNPYQINQVVHTPPAFTQQRFDYTENLSIYDKYEMTRPNPFNADVSYNRATPSWYYFYNNYHALIKLENGTYRHASYLRIHGSFTTAASVRNGYGFNHDFTMTDEAKAIYGNYFYHIGVNQSVDYAIDWLNRYTKENTLIVYSTNIDNDVRKLNDGTATVRKAVNDQGKFVYCIL
ncbi:hypothetical protein A5816_000080 [Enterococcus sp. 3G1_DIV0629]|uniref:YiiX/YebB-like N1pC/P60 family cysteine hydrolase n=1 Tax=Enterococcus TaxID=1350 RepID=UPI000A32F67A|nr:MULTISPECIES: YiiX/YebB-like N1pC/P60 family cysteine hydrolase [Enterococcus]EGP5687768.1 hypothetical protein [Enterococcus faecium]EME7219381.1 hypothetical protein [Enterococcus faecium]EME8085967.1 hypothetical protein [Enterococcus faecium]EME8122674.1 hypothetical protein [Enterococcus faecium]EME8198244.1 hypothetical protein [Enterococcus faecium]